MAKQITDDKMLSGTAEVVVENEPEVKDEFSDAFNAAEGLDKNADPLAAKVLSEEEIGDKTIISPVKETTTAKSSPESVSISASPVQQPGESDEKYEQRYKTLQGIHKHDKETWEVERSTLLAQIEEVKKLSSITKPPASEEKLTDREAADLYDSLTPEQKEALKEYEADFDVVSKMEGLKRGAELNRLKQELRHEFLAELTGIKSQLAPVVSRVDADDLAAHFDTIRFTHEDYESYQEGADGFTDLITWVQSKPRYLQPALIRTLKEGRADEVVDLLTDFKRENNVPLTSSSNQNPYNVVDIDAKAKKKAALTTVTTRRGAVSTGYQVADDFEGAFDEALNKSR